MTLLRKRYVLTTVAIIAMFSFCAGCSPKPWKVQSDVVKSEGAEVIFLQAGNGYGVFGHVVLRIERDTFSFWMVGSEFMMEHMSLDDFTKLYFEYEQRDGYGMEIELNTSQRLAIFDLVQETAYKPFPGREKYNVLTNNCVTGVWLLLCAALEGGVDANPLPHNWPAELRAWITPRFKVLSNRFYASHRHALMYEFEQEGESITDEFFVPFADSDVHEYNMWRMVYTEDLQDEAFILRPIAGATNLATGVVQTAYGIVGMPFGKTPNMLYGAGSTVSAVPELLFWSVRRAGKTVPMSSTKVREILKKWKPSKAPKSYGGQISSEKS